MNEPPNEKQLDRMLAHGRLSGPGRDRVLSKLLAERRAARRRRRLLLGAPLLAAAAVLVLWLRPPRDGFRPRGGADAAVIDVTCRDGNPDRCPHGGTLVFRVDGASAGGFLVAWAEPAGGGPKIWYFAEGAVPLRAQVAPQVIPIGVQLGADHPAGSYDIHALVTDRPPPRDQARAPIIRRFTVTP